MMPVPNAPEIAAEQAEEGARQELHALAAMIAAVRHPRNITRDFRE